ncbi:hypothetical protein BPAE_0037g00170 [Botrytis paeoniae]|uniref:Uncharacterized protein n=1 Tax=Botrytis paeoniae TaxID=278948 RepID=A0A4Z1FSH1_9HELO|nr:hypothetical protein BPAE_0037g00170 [Botrytis paeoniae]
MFCLTAPLSFRQMIVYKLAVEFGCRRRGGDEVRQKEGLIRGLWDMGIQMQAFVNSGRYHI